MMLASLAAVGRSRLSTCTNLTLSLSRHAPRRNLFQVRPPATTTNRLFCKAQLLANLKLVRLHAGMAGRGAANGTNRKTSLKAAQIIAQLVRFVWPKDGAGIKIRVVVALALLVGSKLLNVAVPFVFKEIVDFLNKNTQIKDFASTTQEKIILTMIVLALGYGAARAGASLFGELRNAVFARVAQSSVTQLATKVINLSIVNNNKSFVKFSKSISILKCIKTIFTIKINTLNCFMVKRCLDTCISWISTFT